MRFDKLTTQFQQVLGEAQSIAVGLDNAMIEPVHIMKAMLDQPEGSIYRLLIAIGADMASLRSQLGAAIDQLPQVVSEQQHDVNLSQDAARLLNAADKLAQKRKDDFISSELFLLAALDDQGSLGQILRGFNIEKAKVEQAIAKMRGGQNVRDQNAESTRNALETLHYRFNCSR